jgi:hypothetical protein
MPPYKSQHYVPRSYLRSFSIDREGKAISLFNLTRNASITLASLKDQCASNYTYGRDLKLEKLLQNFEGKFSSTLKKIEHNPSNASANDLNILRDIAYLQHARTEIAMRHAREFYEATYNMIHEPLSLKAENLHMSNQEIMHQSIKMFVDARKIIADLKVCLIVNYTQYKFVTSDNPAIFTNKLHAQKLRTNRHGIGSSGAMLIFPLSPELLLMCYDGDVYTIKRKEGNVVYIKKYQDICSLNQLQYIFCDKNIYFSQWKDHGRIEREFFDTKSCRIESIHELRALIPDDKLYGYGEERFYNKITKEYWKPEETKDKLKSKRRLIVSFSNHPYPPSWLSNVQYRNPIRTYSDGSSMGYVRKAVWQAHARNRS